MTITGHFTGSPQYAPPEVLVKNPQHSLFESKKPSIYSFKSDNYAFGLTLALTLITDKNITEEQCLMDYDLQNLLAADPNARPGLDVVLEKLSTLLLTHPNINDAILMNVLADLESIESQEDAKPQPILHQASLLSDNVTQLKPTQQTTDHDDGFVDINLNDDRVDSTDTTRSQSGTKREDKSDSTLSSGSEHSSLASKKRKK
jgi:hypothetical protein